MGESLVLLLHHKVLAIRSWSWQEVGLCKVTNYSLILQHVVRVYSTIPVSNVTVSYAVQTYVLQSIVWCMQLNSPCKIRTFAMWWSG